jgi:hypothetical protein
LAAFSSLDLTASLAWQGQSESGHHQHGKRLRYRIGGWPSKAAHHCAHRITAIRLPQHVYTSFQSLGIRYTRLKGMGATRLQPTKLKSPLGTATCIHPASCRTTTFRLRLAATRVSAGVGVIRMNRAALRREPSWLPCATPRGRIQRAGSSVSIVPSVFVRCFGRPTEAQRALLSRPSCLSTSPALHAAKDRLRRRWQWCQSVPTASVALAATESSSLANQYVTRASS